MADLRTYQEQSFRALQAREARYARQIATIWRDTLNDIRAQMSRLYERYARDGILSKADMTRYNRLVTTEKQLLETVSPAIRRTLRTVERMRPEQYQASFFRAAWAIDQASGLRLGWGTLNRDAVLESLANTFYDNSKWQYGVRGRAVVTNALNEGLAQGKSYQRMIRDIKGALNLNNARALVILRTEGQTAVNAGADDAYIRAAERGVEGVVVWDATLDGRTRPDHATMDQRTRNDDGLFYLPNGDTAPYPVWEGLSADQRINCRCHARFEIAGYSPQLRRTREDGLVPYQSYGQWEDEHERLRF